MEDKILRAEQKLKDFSLELEDLFSRVESLRYKAISLRENELQDLNVEIRKAILAVNFEKEQAARLERITHLSNVLKKPISTRDEAKEKVSALRELHDIFGKIDSAEYRREMEKLVDFSVQSLKKKV